MANNGLSQQETPTRPNTQPQPFSNHTFNILPNVEVDTGVELVPDPVFGMTDREWLEGEGREELMFNYTLNSIDAYLDGDKEVTHNFLDEMSGILEPLLTTTEGEVSVAAQTQKLSRIINGFHELSGVTIPWDVRRFDKKEIQRVVLESLGGLDLSMEALREIYFSDEPASRSLRDMIDNVQISRYGEYIGGTGIDLLKKLYGCADGVEMARNGLRVG